MAKYNYEVTIPITGSVLVTVSSDTELDEDSVIELAMSSDFTLNDIGEWDIHNQIVRGNVFYGIQNEVEVVAEYED